MSAPALADADVGAGFYSGYWFAWLTGRSLFVRPVVKTNGTPRLYDRRGARVGHKRRVVEPQIRVSAPPIQRRDTEDTRCFASADVSRCLSKYDESIKRGYCRTATARAPSPRPDGGPSVPVVQVTTDRLLFYTGYNFICLCVLDDDQPPASVGSIGFYFLPPSAWPLFFTPREGRTGVVQEVLLLSARVCYFFYSFLLFVFLSFVFFSEPAFCFVGSVIVCSRFARALLSGAGGGKCSRRVLICCSLPFTFFRFLFFLFFGPPFRKILLVSLFRERCGKENATERKTERGRGSGDQISLFWLGVSPSQVVWCSENMSTGPSESWNQPEWSDGWPSWRRGGEKRNRLLAGRGSRKTAVELGLTCGLIHTWSHLLTCFRCVWWRPTCCLGSYKKIYLFIC